MWAGRVYDGCNDVFRALGSLESALDEHARPGDRASADRRQHDRRWYFAPRLLGAFASRIPASETSVQAHNRQR